MAQTILISLLFLCSIGNSNRMLVRIYTGDFDDLGRIPLKSLDIAGRKHYEYFDIVVSPEEYGSVISSGIQSEVIAQDIDLLKEEFRGQYHSYNEVTQILRNLASTYPSICIIDSIGQSYEGRWIYAVKISDDPAVEDDTEPGILFDGLHHSREWATIETVLFYADTLTQGYGTDPVITDLVDNNEVWLIPIVNPDGYVYDYPGQHMWRKNRKPYLGYIGTDPNRNYNGALNGDPKGDWCSVPPGGAITNYPSHPTFCGAYAGFANCVDRMIDFHRMHDINANVSYHSYAEEVIWPWAYTSSTTHAKTPDSTAYEQIAQGIASRIHRLGSGYYDPSGSLYPNTGTTRTWVYGYHHYIKGTSSLSFTIEIGTSFYQPVGDLDYIAHENWKGALYLALKADSIREYLLPAVPSPQFVVPDSVPSDSFTFYWSPVMPQYTHPDIWRLDKLENYSYALDDVEAGTSNWILTGFYRSSARSHSGTYSLFSSSGNNIANVAMTKYPYLVESGDSLTFWSWYDLENNYDVAVVEVSTDMKEWHQLDERYSNYQNWTQKQYSLEPWVGKAIYIRFRAVTDDNTLDEGFYVDDIYPVPLFGSESTISSSITDTFYTFIDYPEGEYYFRVLGHNDRGWGGNYSDIRKTVVYPGVAVALKKQQEVKFSCSLSSDLRNICITYVLPRQESVIITLFDASGRRVKQMKRYDAKGRHRVTIDHTRSGIWFVRVRADGEEFTGKVVTIF